VNQQDFPAPSEGFVVTHTLIVEDVGRSVDFYVNTLGASELMRVPDGPARHRTAGRRSVATCAIQIGI